MIMDKKQLKRLKTLHCILSCTTTDKTPMTLKNLYAWTKQYGKWAHVTNKDIDEVLNSNLFNLLEPLLKKE